MLSNLKKSAIRGDLDNLTKLLDKIGNVSEKREMINRAAQELAIAGQQQAYALLQEEYNANNKDILFGLAKGGHMTLLASLDPQEFPFEHLQNTHKRYRLMRVLNRINLTGSTNDSDYQRDPALILLVEALIAGGKFKELEDCHFIYGIDINIIVQALKGFPDFHKKFVQRRVFFQFEENSFITYLRSKLRDVVSDDTISKIREIKLLREKGRSYDETYLLFLDKHNNYAISYILCNLDAFSRACHIDPNSMMLIVQYALPDADIHITKGISGFNAKCSFRLAIAHEFIRSIEGYLAKKKFKYSSNARIAKKLKKIVQNSPGSLVVKANRMEVKIKSKWGKKSTQLSSIVALFSSRAVNNENVPTALKYNLKDIPSLRTEGSFDKSASLIMSI